MSLPQPARPRLFLEALEDRFLLSVAALTAPAADRPSTVPGQYAVLPPEPAAKDAARPAFSQSLPLDRSAAGAPPGADRDRDDYLLQREEGSAGTASASHHAEALALVRSLAGHSEPQAGERPRSVSLAPGTLAATAIRTVIPPDESSAPHFLAVPPLGTLDPPFTTAAEEPVQMPPALLVMASTETGSRQEVEAATPAADSLFPVSGLAPEPGEPLAGLLPLDMHALRRNADAFFARLGELFRGPGEDLSVRALAPWLLLGWAAAWEVALLPRALRRSGPAADSLLLGTEDEA